MDMKVKVEGLKALDKALGELSKATAKNVLRRVGKKALEPVAQEARELVPVDEGHLKASIAVGTKLTRRQSSIHRRFGGRNTVDVFVGPGGLPQATLREFGGDGNAPQPYMRPAWDNNKTKVLDSVKKNLGGAIKKSAARAAARAAKVGRGRK